MGGWLPELDKLAPSYHTGLPGVKIEPKPEPDADKFVTVNGQSISLPWPFLTVGNADLGEQVIDLSL